MSRHQVLIALSAVILDLGMWAALVVWQHAASHARGYARERLVILDFWFGSVGAPIGGCIAAAMAGILLTSRPLDLGTEIRLGSVVLALTLPSVMLWAKYLAWGSVVKRLPNIDIKGRGLSAVGKLHFVYALLHFAIGWWLMVVQPLFGTGWTWCQTVALCGYCLVALTILLDIRNGIQRVPDSTFIPFCLGKKYATHEWD